MVLFPSDTALLVDMATWLRHLVGPLATPFRALLVSAAGLWLSASWVRGDVSTGVASGLIAAGVATGYVCFLVGRAQLPHAPVFAVYVMEWWSIAPLALAVIATATAVRVTLHLSLPEAAAADKEIAEQSVATVTTFLSSVFISWAADEKESPVAERIRQSFYVSYARPPSPATAARGVHYFKAESRGELLVYSDGFEGIEGWNRAARLARAKGIAEELKNGTSEP